MTDRETLTTNLVYETSHRSTATGPAPLDRDELARKALDYFGYISTGDSGAQKVLRVTVGDTTYDAAGRRLPDGPAPVTLDQEVTRAAIVAFIDAHRAERRLYPESYADRMAAFIDEAHRDGVPAALKRLRKELPK